MEQSYKSTRRACYLGYITQAVSINLATLFFAIFREDFGLSYTNIANLILFTFIVQITVDAVMMKLTCKIGYRNAAVCAHIFAATGLIMLGILPFVMKPYVGILISVFFYSVGGGITEVVISPIIDSLPSDVKAAGMCLLHSFYSIGLLAMILLTTSGLKLIGSSRWFLLPIFWSLVPIFNIFYFARVPLPSIDPESGNIPLRTYFRSPVMYLSVLLMICGGASESAMTQWASLFAEQGLGVSKIIGDIMGPCMFALTMGAGRIWYGICGGKINIRRVIPVFSAITLGCYLLAALSPYPFFSLLGCALCGFGISLMWPGILSMSSASFGSLTSPALFASLALAGDVGCSLGPWITGAVSDSYAAAKGIASTSSSGGEALRVGILASAMFPTLMIIASCILNLILKRQREKIKSSDDGWACVSRRI